MSHRNSCELMVEWRRLERQEDSEEVAHDGNCAEASEAATVA